MAEVRRRERSGIKKKRISTAKISETTSHNQRGSLIIRLIRTGENGYKVLRSKEAEHNMDSTLQTIIPEGDTDRLLCQKEGDERGAEAEETQFPIYLARPQVILIRSPSL